MTDQASSTGMEWTQQEIDLVVADYFDMRSMFLRREPFVKARHHEAITEATGRSRGSVEHKYMNISATLERLSLPWLPGYAPMRNFQEALLKTVEKYVAKEWNEEIIPGLRAADIGTSQLTIEQAPDAGKPLVSENRELERIARKFDPALRDERNRKIGLAGEKFVFESEIIRLRSMGRADLAKRVSWVSQELGDGAGYDILSFDRSGDERYLEVKTTIGHKRTPFYLSRNEKNFAVEAAEHFRIFRLYEWGREPRAFLIKPPLESRLILEPTAYRASLV